MSLAACAFALFVAAHAAGITGPLPPEAPRVQFAAEDLSGHRWTGENLRGRVVLLDFWATWCAPCLAELPRLKTLREQFRREDFEIIGISLDAGSRRAFVSWLNRHRIEWPQVHERGGYSGTVPRQFGVDRLPRTVLIDRDGRIAAVDLRGERLAEAVHTLVAQPPEGWEARR
jgi:thiol-disulfide isomerase/thioredoxin